MSKTIKPEEKLEKIIYKIYEERLIENLSILSKEKKPINNVDHLTKIDVCSLIMGCCCATMDLTDPGQTILLSLVNLFEGILYNNKETIECEKLKNETVEYLKGISKIFEKIVHSKNFEEKFCNNKDNYHEHG